MTDSNPKLSVWGNRLKLGALQEVLEKLQAKRLPMWEKKYGQVPTVGSGSGLGPGWCRGPRVTLAVSVSV